MNGQKRLEEFVAKIILQDYFSSHYSDLEVLDMPDLQDKKNSIGIEVVTLYKDSESARRTFERMADNQKYNANTIKKYEDYLGIGFCLEEPIYSEAVVAHVVREFNNKIQKLQKYIEFSCYELFMFTNCLCKDEYIDGQWMGIISKFCKKINKLPRKFNKLFLVGNSALYQIDLAGDTEVKLMPLNKPIKTYFDELENS